MDERLLIQKVLKGDTSSFGYFVDTYQDMAITISYRICGNRQDAEDIVQNSFVKAYHNLHSFRSDSKFSTWFYRIVYNTSLSHINTSIFNTQYEDYKVIDSDSSSFSFDFQDDIHEKDREKIISWVMDKMPKDESLILTLFYLEENSIKDINGITGLSESNIKVKLHRSRKRFAEIFRKTLQSEEI